MGPHAKFCTHNWVCLETRGEVNQDEVGTPGSHGFTVFKEEGYTVPWKGKEQGALILDLARGG